MKFINKTVSDDGCYSVIQSADITLPNNCAVWPDDLGTDVFYAYHGFVFLTFATVDGVDTVTAVVPNVEALEAWKASLPAEEETEPEPASDVVTWDELAAAYTEGVNSIDE